MLVASVLSLKGGVGKTSVILGLASAAIKRGISTLVVDLDPQANATITLDPVGHTATIADLFGEVAAAKINIGVNNAVADSNWGPTLRVIPGSEAGEHHNHPNPTARQLTTLKTILQQVAPAPELVLIDCPPSLGLLTRSGLVAGNRAILVTEPALFAVTGVQRALEAVHDERLRQQSDLQPLGIVINRARARSSEQDYRIAELKELFGPLVLLPALPERSAVQQAQGAGVAIHDWPSAGARELTVIFDRLLDRLLRSVKEPVAAGYPR